MTSEWRSGFEDQEGNRKRRDEPRSWEHITVNKIYYKKTFYANQSVTWPRF